MSKQKTTARVTVSIAVELGQHWGEECTAKQIHDNAREEALNYLRSLFANEAKCARIVEVLASSIVISTVEGPRP